MSPENAHKLIRIYMGGLILGVNTLYMLSCFLKQFALVGKGLIEDDHEYILLSDTDSGQYLG